MHPAFVSSALIPAWIEAVSTVGALIAACVAAYFGWQTVQHDRDIARRHAAAGVAAWWATRASATGPRWGVVVANEASSPKLGVQITVTGNSRPGGESIEMKLLPPGRYFVESRPAAATGGGPWRKPQAAASLEDFEALTAATTHQVTRIDYSDTALATRWRWTPRGGLVALRETAGRR